MNATTSATHHEAIAMQQRNIVMIEMRIHIIDPRSSVWRGRGEMERERVRGGRGEGGGGEGEGERERNKTI